MSLYDIKEENKAELDFNEAEVAMQMIDEVQDVNVQSRQQFKELYLRIATSLEENDILRLLDNSSVSSNEVDWNQLRTLFRLYEKYGYLITALQVFLPLDWEGKSKDLTAFERRIIKEWNREELEAALARGQDISELARGAILTKNVLLNQWPHIVEASKDKIPSARGFFKNSLTERLVNSANELMKLNLDLSFFQQ